MNGWTIAKLVLAYEGGLMVREGVERHKFYKEARAYSSNAGKPLLVVGIRRHFWEPPNGDVTIDVDPKVTSIEGGIWADERDIPFPDKTFGAVYNAHTLEHMPSIEDAELAISECLRVAEVAVFLVPSPYSIYSNLFCPAHRLRLWFDNTNNTVKVANNRFRTGLGVQPGAGDTSHPPPHLISQSLVTRDVPQILKVGNAYIARG